MSEIVGTHGKFKVRLEPDTSPDMPYDDGSSPVLRYSYPTYGGRMVEQVTELTSFVVPDSIIDALRRWGDYDGLFERYMRIYHGARAFEWWSPNDGYVTFDTAEWRTAMGLTDEAPGVNMSEWRAYCEGDVYGYTVEELQSWTRDSDGAKEDRWVEVTSCWGFYGYDYALEAAKEALAEYAE